MRADKFVSSRRQAWQQLEELVRQARSGGLSSLHPDQLSELGRLYRKAAADLAYARTHVKDEQILEYLNLLVARAQAQVYRPRKRRGSLLRFFTHDFPVIFRQTILFTLVATGVFCAAAFYAFSVARADPAMGEQLLPGWLRPAARSLQEGESREPQGDQSEVLAFGPALSVSIFVNNISVGFQAFAGGVLLGLLTLYALFQNGVMLGALAAFVVGTPGEARFWAFIAPHGALELPAIFLCGGAGLMLGWSLISPGDQTRLASFRRNAGVAVRLVAGAATILVIAGLIEGLITPAPTRHLVKFAVAAVVFIFLCLYLGLAGRRQD